ncbi:Dirigent protein 25 [Bienertia sinuspersici]
MGFSVKTQIFTLTLVYLIAFTISARILTTAPDSEADAPVSDDASSASAAGASSGAAVGAAGSGATGAAATAGSGATAAGAAGGGATGAGASAGSGATGGQGGASALTHGEHPDLVFFMHDILGGSNPTAKAITGIVTTLLSAAKSPSPNPMAQRVNPNVQSSNNNGNNFVGGNGFPVVNGAQLSAGTTMQQLMFGTMIAIDDQLTVGHALNSGMVGRAQGFYVYSSVDGKTQTLAFTAMFIEGGYHNSINFFGVHQTAVTESVVGIMGGTGKYVNAKGFAVVKTLPPTDQHETDGLQTVLEISVFLN